MVHKRSQIRALLPLFAAALTTATAARAVPPPRHATDGSGNVFLGGQFIELGIAPNGGFGPSAARPGGFFGTPGDSGIGMSADHDGFEVGLNLAIDYFLPGNPE